MEKKNEFNNILILKFLRFITLFSIKQCGGKTICSLFGVPVWKIRHMESGNLTKYYLLGIPLFRLYHTPQKYDDIMPDIKRLQQAHNDELELLEDLKRQAVKNQNNTQKQLANIDEKIVAYHTEDQNNTKKQLTDIDERMMVYHAELLERADNLPHKINQ